MPLSPVGIYAIWYCAGNIWYGTVLFSFSTVRYKYHAVSGKVLKIIVGARGWAARSLSQDKVQARLKPDVHIKMVTLSNVSIKPLCH